MNVYPLNLFEICWTEEEDIGDITKYLTKPFDHNDTVNYNEIYFREITKDGVTENGVLSHVALYKLTNIDTIIILKLVKLFNVGFITELVQVQVDNVPYIMIRNDDNILLSDKVDNYYGQLERMSFREIGKKILLQWILSLDGDFNNNVIIKQNFKNKLDVCIPQLLVLNPVLSTSNEFSSSEIIKNWFRNDINEFLLIFYDLLNSKPISQFREEMKNIIANYDPKKLHWVNLIYRRLQNFI